MSFLFLSSLWYRPSDSEDWTFAHIGFAGGVSIMATGRLFIIWSQENNIRLLLRGWCNGGQAKGHSRLTPPPAITAIDDINSRLGKLMPQGGILDKTEFPAWWRKGQHNLQSACQKFSSTRDERCPFGHSVHKIWFYPKCTFCPYTLCALGPSSVNWPTFKSKGCEILTRDYISSFSYFQRTSAITALSSCLTRCGSKQKKRGLLSYTAASPLSLPWCYCSVSEHMPHLGVLHKVRSNIRPTTRIRIY
jgi:hypothetical protein